MYHLTVRAFTIVLVFSHAIAAQAHHSRFQRMYVFGDSYSDIGEGYLDGNGPTAVAYLAEALGFPLIPSNKSSAANQSIDFAVSGAQTGNGEGRKIGSALLGFGMQNQVADFQNRLKEGKIQFDPTTTLFFLAGGLNDRNLTTATTVSNLESEIRTLYQSGARHFQIALLPTAIPGFADMGLRLNPALADIPAKMQTDLPGAQITLSHWGVFFDEVFHNPAQYGIADTTNACAGREIFSQDAKPCAAPDAHYYYHAAHPSTAVHKVVGLKMADEVTSQSK
jgi:phospholipase/lecithinase/hemolysin